MNNLKLLSKRCQCGTIASKKRMLMRFFNVLKLFPLGLESLDFVKVATSLHDFILYLCDFFEPPFLLSGNPVLKMYSDRSIGLQDNYSEK